MAKAKKNDFIDEAISSLPKDEMEGLPLESLSDYRKYNEIARAKNKKLRMCRYPVKQCPIELHPTQRISFSRIDQPSNNLPVHLFNEDIDFNMVLTPGKQYDLPLVVIEHLDSKGYPVWEWRDNPDGSRETHIARKTPRFSLRSVYS